MKKKPTPAISKTAKPKAGAGISNDKTSSIKGGKQLFLEYAKIAWNNYLTHQPAFASLSSRFTTKLAEDELRAINDLKIRVLKSNLSVLRLDLLEDGAAVVALLKSSMWYISEAFLGDKMKLKETGLDILKTGRRITREVNVSIIKKLGPFLNKHKKELEANDNMPATFIKEFNTATDRYLNSLEKTVHAESTFTETNKQLIEDLQARYAVLNKMLKAADVVFLEDAALRKMFTLTALKRQARSIKKTKLVGYIRMEGSKKRIAKAIVSIQNHPTLTTSSDNTGRFEIELEKGIYNLMVKAPGYHVFSTMKTVQEGVRNILPVSLSPLALVKMDQPEQQPTVAKRAKPATNGIKV